MRPTSLDGCRVWRGPLTRAVTPREGVADAFDVTADQVSPCSSSASLRISSALQPAIGSGGAIVSDLIAIPRGAAHTAEASMSTDAESSIDGR